MRQFIAVGKDVRFQNTSLRESHFTHMTLVRALASMHHHVSLQLPFARESLQHIQMQIQIQIFIEQSCTHLGRVQITKHAEWHKQNKTHTLSTRGGAHQCVSSCAAAVLMQKWTSFDTQSIRGGVHHCVSTYDLLDLQNEWIYFGTQNIHEAVHQCG